MEPIIKIKKPTLLKLIFGIVLIVFGIDCVIMNIRIFTQEISITDDLLRFSKNIILIVLLFVAGIYLLFDAMKISKVDKMILSGKTTAEDISKSTGISYNQTCKIMNKLVTKGVYAGVFYDTVKNEIIRQTSNVN
ncbi:MAG: hypothetical protein IJH36_10195 [Clostridia bacterium]|nr:hypothetical protein [Clostridia bacterium]MBQ3463461.1 hypothetical protein [Clostridia bacterium]